MPTAAASTATMMNERMSLSEILRFCIFLFLSVIKMLEIFGTVPLRFNRIITHICRLSSENNGNLSIWAEKYM